MTTPDKEKPQELLPCPFCGGHPKTDFKRDFNSVYCNSGKCINPNTGSWLESDSAIEAWNTRAGIAAPSEALRVAREALTRVAKLNESAGEIGAGMLAIIVGEARAALALLTQSQPEGRQG